MRDLSIIIPAFNESARIQACLESIASYVDARGLDDEVLVVNDGSTDSTVAAVKSMADRFRHLRIVEVGFNGGKGRAVRLGMLAATGRQRLFLDADNSTDIRELDRLLHAADTAPVRPDVIIGSIAVHNSTVTREQSWVRRLVGRLGNKVIQRLVLPGINDSQRGFKIFTDVASEQIFRRCHVDGWAFDVEALAIARGLGFQVLEVPITWEHRDDSRVRPAAYIESLVDVMRIRRELRSGAYDLADRVLPTHDS